jgi:hypothetical protein
MEIQDFLQAYLGTSQDFRRISVKTMGRRILGYGFGVCVEVETVIFAKAKTIDSLPP